MTQPNDQTVGSYYRWKYEPSPPQTEGQLRFTQFLSAWGPDYEPILKSLRQPVRAAQTHHP